MQTITLQKYQTRARNFYREHCKSEAPDSAQICAALLACASDYRPNSFGTLKSALLNDQKARGNQQAAKAIRLGADIVGVASGVIEAATRSTEDVVAYFQLLERQLRTTCFCVNASNLAALKRVPLILNS